MANAPIYVDVHAFTRALNSRELAETIYQIGLRVGANSTLTSNLVEINTDITEVNESVEGVTGSDALVNYLIAEIDRLKRRIESLEAETHGNSISYA